MPVHVSLLRGINVGGNKKLPMADLRALYAALGFRNTSTLLQSGNAVFEADSDNTADLKAMIEAGIEARFGFHSDIFLVSADKLRQIINTCPCTDEEVEEPAKLQVFFLSTTPEPDAVAAYLAGFDGPEHLYIRGDVIYMFFPDGMGKSKVNQAVLDRKLGVSATARNWNTVAKLADMAAAMAP